MYAHALSLCVHGKLVNNCILIPTTISKYVYPVFFEDISNTTTRTTTYLYFQSGNNIIEYLIPFSLLLFNFSFFYL